MKCGCIQRPDRSRRASGWMAEPASHASTSNHPSGSTFSLPLGLSDRETEAQGWRVTCQQPPRRAGLGWQPVLSPAHPPSWKHEPVLLGLPQAPACLPRRHTPLPSLPFQGACNMKILQFPGLPCATRAADPDCQKVLVTRLCWQRSPWLGTRV